MDASALAFFEIEKDVAIGVGESTTALLDLRVGVGIEPVLRLQVGAGEGCV